MSQLAVAPGDGFAVVGGARGDLLTLDLRSLNTAREQAKAHACEVRGVALSRDGSLLATGGDDRRVVVRDPRTLEERFSFPPLDGTVFAWPSARTAAAWRSRGSSSDLPSGTSTGCGPGWPRSASPGGRTCHLLPGSPRPGRPSRSRAEDRGRGGRDLMGEGERLRNERRPEDALGPYAGPPDLGGDRPRPAASPSIVPLAVTLAAIASIHQQGGRREKAGTPGDGRSTWATRPATATRASHSTWAESTPWAARSIGPAGWPGRTGRWPRCGRPWPPATGTAVRSARTPTSTRSVAALTSRHSSPA